FNALSYMWGDPMVTELISLDNEELLVTTSLHAALRQMRGKAETIIVWVDAICIDQSNIDERSSQVGMMGAIYSSAQLVYAWLGEGNADTDAAIEIIQNWTVEMDKPLAEVEDPVEYVSQLVTEESIKMPLTQALTGSIFDPLQSFLSRPYWRRVWTVQELVLSSNATIVCGKQQVSFQKIIYFKSLWDILKITDRIPGLPSWAVDYSYKELEGSFRDYSHCTRSADSAASTTISSTLDPMILSTQGAFLDTVNSFVRVHMPAVTKSEQKAVFVTRSGHVGYGPNGIQEGDEVCILPGCQYPMLVRKKGQAYQVVGACVVYGIM
ncbi:HET-domain-containing protein, partial [Hyaloscypha bicolor E]